MVKLLDNYSSSGTGHGTLELKPKFQIKTRVLTGILFENKKFYEMIAKVGKL